MTKTLSFALAFSAAGTLDLEASLQNARSAAIGYQTERELEQGQIADAVSAVFDQHKGVRLNMPALKSFAATKLNVQPENYATLQERIADYVRENADRPAVKEGTTVVTPAEPKGTRLFHIGRGKAGGVTRNADAAPVGDDDSAE